MSRQPTSFDTTSCAALAALLLLVAVPAHAGAGTGGQAAIHPVATDREMRDWLSHVPVTRAFPPDLAETLQGEAPLFLLEMSTEAGCLPCAHLWATLGRLRGRYGWQIRTIGPREAMIRSGRLGLPWVGHPVAWVRPLGDPDRTIPVAIGTDVEPNIARNLYLAVKMMSGVRPAVGVRGMARFTGIVGARTRAPVASPSRKD